MVYNFPVFHACRTVGLLDQDIAWPSQVPLDDSCLGDRCGSGCRRYLRGECCGSRVFEGSSADSSLLRTASSTMELVRFLATVPLLHEQQDAADIPNVAHAMRRMELEPDQALIRQGDESQAFFRVEKGKASCVAVGEGNEISGRATLLLGENVGAKALSVRKQALPPQKPKESSWWSGCCATTSRSWACTSS